MKTEIPNSKTPATPRARLTLLALALAATTSAAALAQTSVPTPQSVAPNYRPPQTASGAASLRYVEPHAGTWDFYFTIGGMFTGNANINARDVRVDRDTFLDGKIKMRYDDAFSFGFGFGYNITEQLSVHGQFNFASPDYDATFYPDNPVNDGSGNPILAYRVRGEADIFTSDIAVRYDFLTGKFRPYVQGSLGFMHIDTGIPNGESYWVWDGGWGGGWGGSWGGGWGWGGWYRATPTINRTYLTLGATAGLSYYFNDRIFGGLSYTTIFANTSGKWTLNQRIGVSIGWNF